MSASNRILSTPGIRRFQFDCLHFPQLTQYGVISLHQLGDISTDSKYVLKPHRQACYEITYVVSGKGWFKTNDIHDDVQAGDIYIGKPGETHEGGADVNDPYRYFYFGFHYHPYLDQDHRFRKIIEMIDRKQVSCCQDRLDLRTPFVKVLKEINNTTQFSKIMIQNYLEQILILTYRNFSSDWVAKYPGEGLDNDSKRIVYSAIQYIDDQLLRIDGIREVSKAFGYSHSHLTHLFYQETGQSMHKYYTNKRWQKATELLIEGTYNITEIAEMLNYHSIHTFSRAFRNVFGCSPSQYVRKNKTKQDPQPKQTSF